MKIFLLVRASLPWDKLDYNTYKLRGGYFAGRWMYKVDISLTAWRKMFELSFFNYRQKVFNIAKRNWENIVGLEDILISDGSHENTLRIIDKLRKIKDAMIIPIDDDDWTSPHIKRSLETHCHRPIIHWQQGAYDPYRQNKPVFAIRRTKEPIHFFTNNYAFSSYLYSFASKFDQVEMTLMHIVFNDIIKTEMFNPINCNLVSLGEKCLGITNKTLASLSKLNKKNTKKHFKACVEGHKSIKNDLEGYNTLLAEAPWAFQPISETEELHKELKESRKWTDPQSISATTAEKQ